MFRKILVCCSLVGLGFLISPLNAIKIEVTQGNIKPEPIAITLFTKASGSIDSISEDIAKIIENDLDSSGLFETIDKSGFIETAQSIAKNGVNIKNWSAINARFLVYGTIKDNVITFKLVDVVTNKELIKSEVSIDKKNIRTIAHIIADRIYKRVTNEEGYFNTKVVYVSTANNIPAKRTTKLMIVDQDGVNPIALTDGKELVISPRYSPDGRTIAYIAYNDNAKSALGRSAHVYLRTIGQNGRRKLLSDEIMNELIRKNGGSPINMTYAPRFSKNGQSVVLAIIVKGSSAIYRFDMTDNKLVQLTKHNKIDTSPCFSPDGSKIVFTSDRDGKEAIFIMNSDGSNQHKISGGDGKYSQPNWSPRGDLITFSKQKQGQFYIGVMKPDGSGERLITQGFLVEAPTWASNGRYVIYTSQTGYGQQSKLVLTDLTGRYNRLIKTPGDASAPTWSPTYKD